MMEEAERLYMAMPTAKPHWNQLGDVTKSVWREIANKGLTVAPDTPAHATFTFEFEKLLVEKVLPLCSAQEIAVLYKNEDPSWPFPLSNVDPKSPIGKILDLPVPPPTEVLKEQGYSREKISFSAPGAEWGTVIATIPGAVVPHHEEVLKLSTNMCCEKARNSGATVCPDCAADWTQQPASDLEPQMNAYTGPPPEAVVIPPAPAAPKPLTLKERLALKKGTP